MDISTSSVIQPTNQPTNTSPATAASDEQQWQWSIVMPDESDGEDEEDQQPLSLEVKKHSAFWLRHLRLLPTAYTSGDLQR